MTAAPPRHSSPQPTRRTHSQYPTDRWAIPEYRNGPLRLVKTTRARTPDEAAFLAIGPGAQQWLITAAAAGTLRMRTKMIAAVALAKIYGATPVDRALATAAELGRFADEDLGQVMRHQASARPGKVIRLDETRSLQAGTSAWAGFGV